MLFWLISELHFPKKLAWKGGFPVSAERNAGAPRKSPNYYEILANLFSIQTDVDGIFLTGASLAKSPGAEISHRAKRTTAGLNE